MDAIYKLAVVFLISMGVLLLDANLTILFTIGFLISIACYIYIFAVLKPYTNLVTMRIMTVLNFLPIASGLSLLASITMTGKIPVDTFFLLFALLPLTMVLAYTNLSKTEVISVAYLNRFDNLPMTMNTLKILQRWSTFEGKFHAYIV